MIPVLRRALVALLACALLGSLGLAAGSGAQANGSLTASITRTGTNVPGYCSFAGGFRTNVYAPVKTLRLSISPTSPRAGTLMTVTAFVKQPQRTPGGAAYPARTLRGEVVVGIGSKNRVLVGAGNAAVVSGAIFPSGWTARTTFKAPAAAAYKVTVRRIVYNVRGGGSGAWGQPYAGFDLVCSGARNPTTRTTAYVAPRFTLITRKP